MTVPGHPAFNDNKRQPPLRPGDELAGKYRIEQVVGAGAMGVVVQASHIELEQLVAIKFLYPEFAANITGAERFRREARAAVRIKNEHVARVLDVGMLEGQLIPYIVMEYLEGRDLARELKERRQLPAREAMRHVREACEAVAEAHSLGIVHRDLKPANLFLTQRSNGTRLIKVLDFGISKLVTDSSQKLSITDTSILMGSPAYMSPEQLESSRNVDGRADIWSLGVILYELCTGSLPFTGESVPQLVRAVVAGTRAPLAGEDELLAQLEPVVARCLHQERNERFQSIGELSAALDTITRREGGTPVELSQTIVANPEPVPPARDARSGTGGAESAWGSTHGGRRGAWQRRSVPLVGLLALISLGGLWGVYGERRAAQERRAASSAAGMAPSQAIEALTPASEQRPEQAGAPREPSLPEPQVAPVPGGDMNEQSPPSSAVVAAAPGSPPPVPPPKLVTPVAPAKPAPMLASPGAPPGAASRAPAAPGAGGNATGSATAPATAAPSAATGAAAAAAPAPATEPPAASVPSASPAPAAGAPASKASPSDPPPSDAPPSASGSGSGGSAGAPRVEPPLPGRFEIPEFGGRE